MQSGNLLNINLAHVTEAAMCLNVELADRFFADLEQEEISGGEVHATITVRASAGNIYIVQIGLKGEVTVPCDRCLDPLTLPIDVTDTIKIKDSEPEDNDNLEIRYLASSSLTYDLSWDVYEIIATSLPMQRTHAESECNQEVVSYIMGDDESTNQSDEDDM